VVNSPEETPERTLNLGLGATLAFVAAVASGSLNAVVSDRPALGALRLTLLALTSVLLVALGNWKRVPLKLGVPAYFGVQLGVLTALLVASRGFAALAALPLVSQAVLAGSRRWGVIAAVALTAWTSGVFAAYEGAHVLPAVALGFASAAAFVVAFTHVALERVRAQRELRKANEQLRDHAQQAEALAAARERNRIARELHDSLGHCLTIVHVQLQAAAALLGKDDAAAAELLGKATRLTHEGLDDVRRSVGALRGPEVLGPLPEVLSSLVSQNVAAGVDVKLEVEGSPRRLPSPTELTLYRAAQEGLTNVRKHARAAVTRVRLTYSPDSSVRLLVADLGPGAARTEGGFGLLGLKERAQVLGGELSIRTAPGEGFALELVVPPLT
jgi:signal transduction histidine kinase